MRGKCLHFFKCPVCFERDISLHLNAAKMYTAISGFRHTGILLLEADFLPAGTTDITFHTAPSEKPTPAQFLNELRYFLLYAYN